MYHPSQLGGGLPSVGMPGAVGQFVSLVSLSFIDPAELIQYEALFINARPDSTGSLAGNKVKDLLIQTGLPAEILSSIWNLSSVSSNGVMFCFAEFALAMFLVKHVQSGKPLPPTLPPHIQQQLIQSITSLQTGARQRSHSVSSYTASVESPISGATAVLPLPSQPWAISPQEKAQYDATFKLWDPENSGFVTGDRASQVLMQSGLADNILRHIWELSDIQKRGKLSPDEFAIAMHLVYSKLSGRDLPRTLPPELVPPSIRELENLTALAKNQALRHEPQRQISPSASLVGIHRNLPRSRSTSVSQSVAIDDPTKRQDLLHVVELKKKQLAQLKEESTVALKRVTDSEVKLTNWHKDAEKTQGVIDSLKAQKLVLAAPSTTSFPLHDGITESEKAQFAHLQKSLPLLLEKIVHLESDLHDFKLNQIKAKHGPKTGISEEGVQSKAAALLAARMAALGVVTNSLLNPNSVSSPASSVSVLQEESDQLETEFFGRRQSLNELKTKIRLYLDEVNHAISIQHVQEALSSDKPQSGSWNPPVTQVVRFEEGVGLKSREASSLVADLKRISGSHVTDFKPSSFISTVTDNSNVSTLASGSTLSHPLPISPKQSSNLSRPVPVSHSTLPAKNGILHSAMPKTGTPVGSAEVVTHNTIPVPSPLSGAQKDTASTAKIIIPPPRTPSPSKPPKPAFLASKPAISVQDKPEVADVVTKLAIQNDRKTEAVSLPWPSNASTHNLVQAPLNVESIGITRTPDIQESSRTSGAIPPPPPPPPLVPETTSAEHPSKRISVVKPETAPKSNGTTPSTHGSILSAALASHRGRMGIVSDTDDSQSESGWESSSARTVSPTRSPVKPTQVSSSSTPRPGSPYREQSQKTPTPVPTLLPPPPPPPPETDEFGVVKPVSRGPSVVAQEQPASSAHKKPNPEDVGGAGLNIFALAAQEAAARRSVVTKPNTALALKQERGSTAITNPPEKIEIHSATSDDRHFVKPASQVLTSLAIQKSSPIIPDRTIVSEDEADPFGADDLLHPQSEVVVAQATQLPVAAQYFVRVLYDYDSGQEGDLSVKAGSTLTITKQDGEWLYGLDEQGVMGWLPENYTRKNDFHVDEGSPTRLAEASYDFAAQNSDEISVVAGERVRVLRGLENDPWWTIENGDGNRGLVPRNYLAIIESDATSPSDVSSPGGNFSPGKKRSEISPVEPGENPFGDDPVENPFGVDDSPVYALIPGYIDTSSHVFSTTNMSLSTSMDFREYSALRSSSTKGGLHRSTSLTNVDSTSSEEKKRFEAIQEVIMTERSYIDDLSVVINVFMTSLLENGWDVSSVFYNVQDVYDVATKMLEDFELVTSPSAGEHASMGAVILENLDRLESYRLYCTNLGHAMTELNKKRAEDQRLQNMLMTLRQQSKNLDLSSYLLVPMQRITRYPLLFRQILHYTPKDHAEHEATLLALQMCDEFLEKVNAEIKLLETRVKIKEIQRTVDLELPEEGYKLDLFAPTRYMGQRLILKEGLLMKNKSGRQLKAYLFNDMVLFAALASSNSKGKSMALYRKPLMLQGMSLQDIEASCFQIVCGSDSWLLRANSPQGKREWMNAISSAIAAHKREEKNAGTKSKGANNVTTAKRETIGTLRLSLLEAKDLVSGKRLPVYGILQLQDQLIRSRKADAQSKFRWNQSLLFSVFTLDDVIRISLYSYDKYSKDEYLGSAEMQLDLLEYYGEKETEVINLTLKDVASGRLSIQMMYRRA